MLVLFVSRFDLMISLFFFVVDQVSSSILIHSGKNNFDSPAKCCFANTSVGAKNTICDQFFLNI
jgi:hypothetical protein